MGRARPLLDESRRGVLRRRGGLLLVVGLLLSSAAGHPLPAQRLQFRHLRSDDGLAGPWVQAILQDTRGFMWFGTAQGVNRYDGYRMETFRFERGDSTALPDNIVYAMLEDRSGTLWVGTRAGLSRYDRSRGTFTTHRFREPNEPGESRQVRALFEDSRGTLWVGTTEGLFTFDRTRGQRTRAVLPAPHGRREHHVQAIFEDRRGHVLVGTVTDGLFDIDPATGRIRQFGHGFPGVDEFPANEVRAFAQDRAGRLWVSTYQSGIVLLDPTTGRTTVYRHDPSVPTSAPNDHGGVMAVDADGKLWVAFENGGLAHFDPDTRVFARHMTDPNDPSGVSSDSYWSVYVDATGTLWAGTFAGGVDVLRPASDAIQRYGTIAGEVTSLGSNSVVGFAQDSTGNIWVATDGGGLNRLDPQTGRFRRYNTKNSGLHRDAVLGASVDAEGKLWIGMWDGGLSRLDPATGTFTTYTTRNSGLLSDNIFAVHVDRRQRIWAGTLNRGLTLFDPKTGAAREYHWSTPGRESQVWIIEEMHDGRLALGTSWGGMALFDPETGKMTLYSAAPRSPLVLASSDIRGVLEDTPGVLWVGTSQGLDRLDLNRNTIRHYTVKDGLPSNMIAGLAKDRAGKLWVSTDQGITEFDPASGTTQHYTVQDGLQERQFTARAYLMARDGVLLFGGNSGFNLIRPDRIQHNARKPRVVFTGFQVFNKPAKVGEGAPLASHITEAKRISLTHLQSVFTIEFAALDYTAPAKNQYAYKLEGFDRDWTHVGNTRTATYTNLPPGSYTFRVKGTNNDGVWNEEGASIDIVITPPVWATWWFRALLALTIGAIVTTWIRRALARHHHLQEMNDALGLAAERDRESQQYLEHNVLDILGAMQRFSAGDYSVALEVRSDDAIGKLRSGFNSVVADRKRAEEELRQSQKMEAVGRLAGGVAHDFNNLLTVIKGNAELGLQDAHDEAVVRSELEEIERAAERASSLTRQLLAFSRKQILKPQSLLLNDMVVDISRMLRRTLGEDIALTLALDSQLGTVRADPGQIEQVLLNLVVNARDAMPRGGELRIETRNVEPVAVQGLVEAEEIPYVAIVVTDTGIGMMPSVRDRVFEPFFTTKEQGKGTGLGLSTVYGSVKQSGGFVRVESELGVGSTFTVYLPRVQEVDELRVTSEIEAIVHGSATVLLVEDEDAVRRLGSRVLTRAGYTVLTAPNGDAALELAARYEGRIDLLMTDVVMPGMSGRELAERLMPQHPGMRLLYASGYTEDAIVRHGVSSQETAFLEKPFTPNALLRKVREVLEPHADSPLQLVS